MIGCLSALVVLVILGTLTIVTGQKVLAFGSAISTQSPLSTQSGYMNTSDRVNILMMGYGGAGHGGAYLTDSMGGDEHYSRHPSYDAALCAA